MYCKQCGAQIDDNASFCPKCGANVGPQTTTTGNPVSPKSRLVATLLCWFFGIIGVHRFYVGRIGSGIAMIFTIGGLGIWALIDLIVILCGEFKDDSGLKIQRWLD